MKSMVALFFVMMVFIAGETALANSPQKVHINGGILEHNRVLIPLRTVFTEFDAKVH